MRGIASTRGYCELMVHGGRGMFVTLTYSNQHMPSNLALDKRRIQKLHKDMRNAGHQFRFQCAGEYSPGDGRGTRERDDTHGYRLSCRPHYHLNYFGLVFDDLRATERDRNGRLQYQSATLSEFWPEGLHVIYPASSETIGYSSGYLFKDDMEDPRFLERTRVDPYTGEVVASWQVPPQFRLASMRPGLGGGFVDKFGPGAFEGGFIIRDGKRVDIPLYMLERLKAAFPDDYERLKEARQAVAMQKLDTAEGHVDRLLKRHEFGVVARKEHVDRKRRLG